MLMQQNELYEFGRFRLDVTERFLARRAGTRVPLSDRAFDTLCVLIQNAGHLVSKDDLMKAVWPDSFVEENNIDKCIHAIRRALREKPGEQKFIETVRKHGYRFVADVMRVENGPTGDLDENRPVAEIKLVSASKASPSSLSSHSQTSSVVALADWRHELPQPQSVKVNDARPELVRTAPVVRIKPRNYLIALAGLVLGVMAFGYYFLFSGSTASGGNGTRSIAVLPLNPINSGDRNETHEIGIADSLINRINSMEGIVARPLNAIRKYTDPTQDPMTAGREQQADYVLASHYLLADGKIRVTSQLINVRSEKIEETFKIESDAPDIFSRLDAVAEMIGEKLIARFGSRPSIPLAKRGTSDERAYQLFLDGSYLADNRSGEEAKKGLALLEEAVRLDPNYGLAWARKAHAHRSIANFSRSSDIGEEHKRSIEAINRALAIDANLADAHSALCENKMYYEWDFAGAERECKRAIELNPSSPLAHQIYARFLCGRARHDEAIAEIKTAIDLEPASRFNQHWYGTSLHYARRYDEAVTQYKRVIAMDANFLLPNQYLSMTLALQGNEKESYEWWMKVLALQRADEKTVESYKTAYQTSGWQGVELEKVRRFDESDLVYYLGAAFNAQAGNKDKAFEYLERSFQRRELWMSMLRVDPRIDSLRDDLRFESLLSRVEGK